MMHLLQNLDVYAPEPRGLQHVLVAGGTVVWMGDAAPDLPALLGVEVHDFAGQRAIPGLIDCHAHLTGGGGEAGPVSRVPPLGMSDFTRAGITTVVGVLGTDDITRHPRDLLATARGLTEAGISAFCLTGGYHLPPATVTGSVSGDIVHIDRMLGVGEVAVSDHRSSQPSLDELLRVGSEAHTGGLLSGKAGILHLHLGDGSRGLSLVREAIETSEIPARVFNPTHVNRRRALFDEAIDLARLGSTIDLTAFPVAEEDDAWSAPAALDRYLDQGLPAGRITVSSDAGGSLPTFDADGRTTGMDVGRPGALTQVLRDVMCAGRPLETVLPAFTTNVARLLRLPRKGCVAVGADADLVVLDDAGAVTDVMAGGRWHVRGSTVIRRGHFEEMEL